MFGQTVAGIAFARRIKTANPNVVTLLGGPALEAPMGPALAKEVDCIDYVFSGAALVSLPELVSAILDGDEGRCHRIPGVTPRRRSALRVAAEGCAESTGPELDISVPVPLDYDDFLASLARNFGEAVRPILTFETSRGCWWGAIRHCTFCGLNGPSMASREMSPDQALAQFEMLFARYPQVKHFVAVDNILPLAYLKDVLPRLRPPPGVTIFYEVKPNMDEEDVRTLAASGVRVVQPGIEALDSSTLKRINKGVSAFQNIRFLKYCRQHGWHPIGTSSSDFPESPRRSTPNIYAISRCSRT
jgi:magnesium-protoporphyrin IX monomethyl ester (oxidative) cyclase